MDSCWSLSRALTRDGDDICLSSSAEESQGKSEIVNAGLNVLDVEFIALIERVVGVVGPAASFGSRLHLGFRDREVNHLDHADTEVTEQREEALGGSRRARVAVENEDRFVKGSGTAESSFDDPFGPIIRY